MPTTPMQPPIHPGVWDDVIESTSTATENMWLVIIHNDDVTPYEYVLLILELVFFLSSELAEHITWMAHTEGRAGVVVRPRAEAERLIKVAQGRARADGFPLSFSMEPE